MSSERLTRWRLKLAEYNFNVVYRKGSLNGNADFFSRIGTPSADDGKPTIDILENLLSITSHADTYVDKINYKSDNILQSPNEQAIAFTTSADSKFDHGIPLEIRQNFDGYSHLCGSRKQTGSCHQWRNARNIFTLITASDKSSIDTLKQCLRNLHAKCKQLGVKQVAFAKHNNGLDKLNWDSISHAINTSLIQQGVECSVYTNTRKPNPMIEISVPSKIRELQENDGHIQKIKAHKLPKGYIMEDGVLLKIRRTKTNKIYKQLVIPQEMKSQILQICHDNFTGGHLGEHKTWAKLNNRFVWENSYKDTMQYVKSCEICAKIKKPSATQAPLNPIVNFDKPFDKLGVDILELTRSSSGNKYVVIFTDYLTNWLKIFRYGT